MRFCPIENILNESQIPTIDLLEKWDLLKRWNTNTKKVFIHFFISNLNEKLENTEFFVFRSVPNCLEMFEYFDYKKFNSFFNKFLKKINIMIRSRIIFIEQDCMFPNEIDSDEELSFWYGEFYDHFQLQTNSVEENNTIKFKKFLNKYTLHELKKTFNINNII